MNEARNQHIHKSHQTKQQIEQRVSH